MATKLAYKPANIKYKRYNVWLHMKSKIAADRVLKRFSRKIRKEDAFKSWHEPRSGLRANHFSKQSFQRDSLRDRTRASPMLSPQNQRNRALQRAFQGTTDLSVLASAAALPGAIAPQAPP